LLAARSISAVPVVDAAGQLLGIVTEGDLIRRLADQPHGPLGWFFGMFRDPKPLIAQFAKAHGAVARDVMSAKPVTVGESDTGEHIAQLMEKHHIRRVPVVRGGELVGIISRADLLRAVLRPQATTAAARQGDRDILRAVIAAMREQPWTDTFWVYPNVEGGVVMLYGYTRTDTQRDGLRLLAQSVPGVQRVEDRTQPMPLYLRATL
jgi:CBS domain-containing protein